MNHYAVAKRILRCRLPYGGKKEITEGYVVVDMKTKTIASDTYATDKEARQKALHLNNSLFMKGD